MVRGVVSNSPFLDALHIFLYHFEGLYKRQHLCLCECMHILMFLHDCARVCGLCWYNCGEIYKQVMHRCMFELIRALCWSALSP